MDVSNVTEDDGKECARLMEYFRAGIYEMRGNQAAEFYNVSAWLQGLALSIAKGLNPPPSQSKTQKKLNPGGGAGGLPGGMRNIKYNPGDLSKSKQKAKSKKKK